VAIVGVARTALRSPPLEASASNGDLWVPLSTCGRMPKGMLLSRTVRSDVASPPPVHGPRLLPFTGVAVRRRDSPSAVRRPPYETGSHVLSCPMSAVHVTSLRHTEGLPAWTKTADRSARPWSSTGSYPSPCARGAAMLPDSWCRTLGVLDILSSAGGVSVSSGGQSASDPALLHEEGVEVELITRRRSLQPGRPRDTDFWTSCAGRQSAVARMDCWATTPFPDVFWACPSGWGRKGPDLLGPSGHGGCSNAWRSVRCARVAGSSMPAGW